MFILPLKMFCEALGPEQMKVYITVIKHVIRTSSIIEENSTIISNKIQIFVEFEYF